jgi:hypothetical protein
MALTVRSLHSPEVDDLARWVPDDPQDVLFLVQLEIGQEANGSADLFQIVVATPRGLERYRRARTNPIIFDRGLLVMSVYSRDRFRDWLTRTLARCDAGCWAESVQLLRRFFLWEYDDYRTGTSPGDIAQASRRSGA